MLSSNAHNREEEVLPNWSKKRPRPIRDTKKDKHFFLKHAKHLKDVGLRYDDDLTRLQQSERQVYSKQQKRRKLRLFIRLQQGKGRLTGSTASRRKKAARKPNSGEQAVQRRLNRTLKLIGVTLCKAELA